jgi:hypothetical protein
LWDYLKANAGEAERLGANRLLGIGAARGIEPARMSTALYRNFRVIMKRAFSIKPGTFFLLFFALIYELSKKFPVLNLIVPVASVIIFGLVLLTMCKQCPFPLWIPDIGACSATLCLLWALAMVASPDGPAARLLPTSPAGNEISLQTAADDAGEKEPGETGNEILHPTGASASDENLRERRDVTVEYYGNEGEKFSVWINTDSGTKEIFYRTSPSGDFRSTGFSDDKGPDGTLLPICYLSLDAESAANLWIKYTDIDGKTHGPYEINFDHSAERMKTIRKILDEDDIKWVDFFQDENGVSVYARVAPDLAFHFNEPDVVERIMYGINRKIPNMERILAREDEDETNLIPSAIRNKFSSFLVKDSKEKIWFVSTKIIFSDGSESDVRIFDNPYAEEQ